jgi:KAP family P-loop domain
MITGYDVPASRSEDLLGRWSFARQAYRIIDQTPASWSVRLGIHGKWGDGKTTVLRYIRSLAGDDNHVIVAFTPWSAKTRDELWRDFLVAFGQSLQENGIDLGTSTAARIVSALLKYEDLTKVLSAVNRIAEATSRGFFHLLRELLNPNGLTLARIRQQLGERRIWVLVDDLDRAEPEILPFLFLALRDIFDLPGFTFVLAFDDDAVANVLERTRLPEDHGSLFLDKLLDFRLALPSMTQEQTQQMLTKLAKTYLRIFDEEASNAVASQIPKNPRRIKRFVRHLMVLQPSLERFETDEIDQYILYLAQLVHLESQALVQSILEELDDSNVQLLVSRKEEREERRALIAGLIRNAGVRVSEEYLVSVVEKLLDNAMFRFHSSVTTVRLLTRCPSVTAREANAVLAGWRQRDRQLSWVNEWIVDHAANFDLGEKVIAEELFGQLSRQRKAKLEEAASSVAESSVNACVEGALDCLELQIALFREGLRCVGESFYRRSGFVETLAVPMLEWAHFQVNEADRRSRERERKALAECISLGVEDPEGLLRWLQPWGLTPRSFAKEREELLSDSMPHIENAVAASLIEKFGEHLGLDGLAGNDGECWRYILSKIDGPFWQRMDEIVAALTGAGKDSAVYENCIRLFECICIALRGEGWPLEIEHVKGLLAKHRGLARDLWSAVISQPVQFRMQSDLRQMREQLVKTGISEEALPLPAWWVTPERYEEVTGRPLPPS